MQLLIAIAFACIAFALPTSFFFQLTLAAFWLVAFTSATHDIAADGFYMHGLDDHQQSLFVGIRSTFYRIATLAGQGLLVIVAGNIEKSTGNVPLSWTVVFGILSAFFLIMAFYHGWILPRPASDHPVENVTATNIMREFLETFKSFFKKEHALVAILFMLLYRLPEAQLVKLIRSTESIRPWGPEARAHTIGVHGSLEGSGLSVCWAAHVGGCVWGCP
jgi:PAT family beta-lactamase induction signal transducer AmpG